MYANAGPPTRVHRGRPTGDVHPPRSHPAPARCRCPSRGRGPPCPWRPKRGHPVPVHRRHRRCHGRERPGRFGEERVLTHVRALRAPVGAGNPRGDLRRSRRIYRRRPALRRSHPRSLAEGVTRLGQHFLADRNLLDKIVDALDPRRDDVVIEIGPGEGNLDRRPSAARRHGDRDREGSTAGERTAGSGTGDEGRVSV